ncbi:MAG: LytTR family transcriptional regulator [Lachnospiraceae bacterium]|nr:LytTR family transcriptional regulator [Lachnospiraceae bacterium]
MKVTIMDPLAGEEEEIIIKCARLSDTALALISELKKNEGVRGKATSRLHVYLDGEIHLIEPTAVYYFEYVDQKVFAYCKENVYEIKKKLYELEEILPGQDFIRVSKSSILNLDKISSLAPAFGGRFEANLKNGEKIIISRQYVNTLKEALGL